MVTKSFMDMWIEESGPWLYHITKKPQLRRRLFRLGLLPGGVQGARPLYSDDVEARPGHVYLCTAEGLPAIIEQMFPGEAWSDPQLREWVLGSMVAIDLRGLDPIAISPDEDCCYLSHLTGLHVCPFLRAPGVIPADQVVKHRHQRDEPEDFLERPYYSFGQWAEAEGIGSDPEHTAACWSVFGSLAHRGSIPAHLLRPVESAELSLEASLWDETFLCAA